MFFVCLRILSQSNSSRSKEIFPFMDVQRHVDWGAFLSDYIDLFPNIQSESFHICECGDECDVAPNREILSHCWWMCSSAHLLLLSCSAHFANLLGHYIGSSHSFREFKNRHFVMLLFLFWYFNPLFSGSGDKYFFALSHISGGRGVGRAWNKRIFLAHSPCLYW